mmetsp:Transcript_137734/g.250407  ORF Transcript_137734/g.250407 Transcript_137734/m.250407 type:complete len:229 (+) Transcript_137734:81-767(+)
MLVDEPAPCEWTGTLFFSSLLCCCLAATSNPSAKNACTRGGVVLSDFNRHRKAHEADSSSMLQGKTMVSVMNGTAQASQSVSRAAPQAGAQPSAAFPEILKTAGDAFNHAQSNLSEDWPVTYWLKKKSTMRTNLSSAGPLDGSEGCADHGAQTSCVLAALYHKAVDVLAQFYVPESGPTGQEDRLYWLWLSAPIYAIVLLLCMLGSLRQWMAQGEQLARTVAQQRGAL